MSQLKVNELANRSGGNVVKVDNIAGRIERVNDIYSNLFQRYLDVDGNFLTSGYIYVGAANQNPETNPIDAIWPDGTTAVQPIRTLDGYPEYNDAISQFTVATDYSIRVKNLSGTVVYDVPSVAERHTTRPTDISTYTFITDGVQVSFVLPIAVTTKNNTQVYINGIYQEKSTYSVAGQNVVFYNPPTEGKLEITVLRGIVIGTSGISMLSHVATAGQTVFTVPVHAIGTATLQVYVNGVLLLPSDYVETTSTTVTISGISLGDEVVAIVYQSQDIGTATAGNISYNSLDGSVVTVQSKLNALETPATIYTSRHSGNGVLTDFTLPVTPAGTQYVNVYLSGVYQNKNTFSLIGNVLRFSEAPGAGIDNIEVLINAVVQLSNVDSSVVTYTPAGTGAVPTDVQTQLRNIQSWAVNVKDAPFYAKGDGVTDDTAAIQAAASSGAATITVPPGTYILNQYVTLQSGQSWIGLGNPVIKMKNGASIPRCAFYMENDTDILIQGITFDGNGSNQTNYNTAQKGLIEIQSFCQRVTLRDVVVKNALQWGMLLKGNTTVGQPRSILLDNVTTQGSLGTGTGGVAGSDGDTGIAWVAGENITIIGGTSFDYFDIESNTPTTQLCDGIITGRTFRNGADVGFNVKVIGNTFLMPSVNTVACRVTYQYAQIINNQFIETDPQTNAKPRAGAWIGIGIEANNTSFINVQGNTFSGTDYCAIAPRRLGFCNVTENNIYCSSTDIVSTITYDSVAFHYGAIVMPSGSIRDAVIDGNKITGNSSFTLAQIDLATTDQRQLVVTGNSVGYSNTTSLGKLYVYGARAYDQQITSNSAVVSTSYTTTNTIDGVEVRGKKVYYVKPNTTTPTDGTHTVGDISYTSAPTAGGFMGIVCTTAGTPGTWKTFGAITP